MANLSEVAKKGDRIKIFTAEMKIDPNVYKITGFKQSIVELENVETKKFHRVHKTRIAKIIVEGENLEEVQKTMDKTEEKPEATQPNAPQQEAPKPKPQKPNGKQEKVNFKQMIDEGWDVWSKAVKFTDKDQLDVPGIKAEAHCAIAPDGKQYRVFNTYNGVMGKKDAAKKKNPSGVIYAIADEKTLEKKRKDLEKKGYKRRAKPKKA
jgi:hypothetical protein